MKRITVVMLALFLVYSMAASSATVYASTSNTTHLCTEKAGHGEAELFGTVHDFIHTLGKPFCFQFLRWSYLDAFVDVPLHQKVLSIDVIKILIPGSPDWSASTRLSRCRAFYADGFRFIKQVGFVRYYSSKFGPFSVELGVDSCFLRAE